MPFSIGEDSSTKVDSSQIDVALNAGGYSQVQRGGKKSVIVGQDYYKLGKGATLNITTSDYGAIAGANSAIADTIKAFSNITDKAVGGYEGLSETKITDGANLTTKSNQVTIIALGIVAAILGGFYYFRRA